jgi:alkylation response protein AidB-like acyl-CoA dehydrogenase
MSGGRSAKRVAGPTSKLIDLAVRTGQSGDIRTRALVAEAHALVRVQGQLVDRVTAGLTTGALPDAAGAIIRLFMGESWSRRAEIGLEIAGTHALAAAHETDPEMEHGEIFLSRQAFSLGGGSTEMARNVISERVLGMPREVTPDHGVPFREVRQGR